MPQNGESSMTRILSQSKRKEKRAVIVHHAPDRHRAPSTKTIPGDGFFRDIAGSDSVFAEGGFERFGIVLPEMELPFLGIALSTSRARATETNLEGSEDLFMTRTEVGQQAEQPVLSIFSGKCFGKVRYIVDDTTEGLR